jgi:phage FluMu gp28-like protein
MPSLTTAASGPSAADLRAYFLPYQVRWITDDRPVAVAEKSRRIGWTYASAFRAVDRRLRLGTNLFYTAADLTGAREFVEDCCRWARVFNAAADDEGERPVDDADMTAFVVRFASGARIVAGSSNPKFFRGKGGDADADEFAFHEHPRELYKAMQPAALMWGHQLRAWSTHNGDGSFFHHLVRAAREGAPRDGQGSGDAGGCSASAKKQAGSERFPAVSTGRADALEDLCSGATGATNDAPEPLDPDAVPMTNQRIASHRVTLLDAVNQGLVERIRNLPAPDLTARRDFVEEIRASCPDEAAYREEYLCEPGADGSALLGYAAIAACEAANLQLADVEALAAEGPASSGGDGRAAGPLYAGFDVGRKQDRSVLWVVERVGDVLWTRCARVMGDATFAVQEGLVDRLMQNRRVKRLCVDATGIGMMLAERLRHRHGHRVEPVHFTAPVKAELAMPLVRLFQGRLVRVPAEAAVREDLHKVRRTVTAAHHVRLDAPRDADGHADRFWALALACHAAEQSPAGAGQSLPRKPVGW